MSDSRTVYVKLGIKDGKYVADEIGNVTGQIEKMGTSVRSMAGTATAAAAVAAAIYGIAEAAKASLKFLSDVETANLSIATSFMLNGKYIDEQTGKVLQGRQALTAAQADSKSMMAELQVANMQTVATLDQLVRAYQEALPIAMSKGFDKEKVKEFTVAMVQAAGAIGLSLDQLGQETRSMLTGDINQDSRIAQVLGLTSDDVKSHMANADELFTFLMGKLDAYRIAGVETQQTWNGLWSNVEDIAKQSGGMALEPLFQAIKYELIGITGELVKVDEKTKQISWNPAFLEGIETVKSGIVNLIGYTYALAKAVDMAGGGWSKFWSAVYGGESTSWGRGMAAQADMFFERAMTNEKAMEDLANRAAGFDPNGNSPKAGYQQNDPVKDAKAEEKARRERERRERQAREISMVMEQIRTRDFLIGKQADEKELLQLDLKHQQEINRLKEAHATKAQLAEAAREHQKEREDLKSHQDEERAYKAAASQAKIAEANFQAQAAWLDKLDAYKLKTGKITEEESLQNKYDRQRDLLALKQTSLEVDIEHEENAIRRNELEAEYWRILEQIENLDTEEDLEMEQLRIDKQLERNALLSEWAAIRLQSAEEERLAAESFAAMETAVYDEGLQRELLRIQAEEEAWIQSYAMNTDSFEVYERRKAQIQQFFSNERLKIEQKEIQLKMGMAQSGFSNMSRVANAFYALSNQKSKEAFLAYQIMKSGETVISTASGAMKAYDAMASIPYVGPALGAAAAAAVVAEGAVQLSNLWSTSPSGGGNVSSGGGGGGRGGEPTVINELQSRNGGTSTEQQPTIIINIHAIDSDYTNWDGLARNVIYPAIKKAANDGVH